MCFENKKKELMNSPQGKITEFIAQNDLTPRHLLVFLKLALKKHIYIQAVVNKVREIDVLYSTHLNPASISYWLCDLAQVL